MEQLRCDYSSPDRCTRCGGWIEFTEDHDGAYYRCLSCGRHTYPAPDVGSPDGDDIQPDNRADLEEPGGEPDPPQEEDGRPCAPCAPWYPCRPETQDRYGRIREIITREDLSVRDAMRRFNLSRRTIYRIRKG